jgi:hypothetical protein
LRETWARRDAGGIGRRGFVLGAISVALLAGCASPGSSPAAPLHATLERKVVVGYQGWYRTPGDGSDMGWWHYRAARTNTFAPGSLGIDYWPDVSELTAAERFDTAFTHADGTVAQVFSSHHPLTVERHFRWMKEHGIDAAFLQRFSAPMVGDTPKARMHRRAADNVLRFAQAGAEKHGRGLAVMYDLSGMGGGAMAEVQRDWRHLIDDLKVRTSPAYQHHLGKPLVVVWGIGFNDGRAYTLDDCAELIRFLKDDPKYGGNSVMIGIPSWWREQKNDATRDPRLHAVLQLADILSPWTPGRYRDLPAIRAHAENLWGPDRTWCTERGIGYMPVVFPGFSWRNLKGVSNAIDRLDGRFLWEQYRLLANAGFTRFYQAMFDEMDEGTQIFKTTNNPPEGATLLTYAPLPPDYYLRLVGVAAEHIHAGRPLPERIPDFPGEPEINAYLRRTDDAVYGAAPPVPAPTSAP